MEDRRKSQANLRIGKKERILAKHFGSGDRRDNKTSSAALSQRRSIDYGKKHESSKTSSSRYSKKSEKNNESNSINRRADENFYNSRKKDEKYERSNFRKSYHEEDYIESRGNHNEFDFNRRRSGERHHHTGEIKNKYDSRQEYSRRDGLRIDTRKRKHDYEVDDYHYRNNSEHRFRDEERVDCRNFYKYNSGSREHISCGENLSNYENRSDLSRSPQSHLRDTTEILSQQYRLVNNRSNDIRSFHSRCGNEEFHQSPSYGDIEYGRNETNLQFRSSNVDSSSFGEMEYNKIEARGHFSRSRSRSPEFRRRNHSRYPDAGHQGRVHEFNIREPREDFERQNNISFDNERNPERFRDDRHLGHRQYGENQYERRENKRSPDFMYSQSQLNNNNIAPFAHEQTEKYRRRSEENIQFPEFNQSKLRDDPFRPCREIEYSYERNSRDYIPENNRSQALSFDPPLHQGNNRNENKSLEFRSIQSPFRNDNPHHLGENEYGFRGNDIHFIREDRGPQQGMCNFGYPPTSQKEIVYGRNNRFVGNDKRSPELRCQETLLRDDRFIQNRSAENTNYYGTDDNRTPHEVRYHQSPLRDDRFRYEENKYNNQVNTILPNTTLISKDYLYPHRTNENISEGNEIRNFVTANNNPPGHLSRYRENDNRNGAHINNYGHFDQGRGNSEKFVKHRCEENTRHNELRIENGGFMKDSNNFDLPTDQHKMGIPNLYERPYKEDKNKQSFSTKTRGNVESKFLNKLQMRSDNLRRNLSMYGGKINVYNNSRNNSCNSQKPKSNSPELSYNQQLAYARIYGPRDNNNSKFDNEISPNEQKHEPVFNAFKKINAVVSHNTFNGQNLENEKSVNQYDTNHTQNSLETLKDNKANESAEKKKRKRYSAGRVRFFKKRSRKQNRRQKALIAKGVIKPPKDKTKHEPELYWKEWWPKYAYIEKLITKVDANDDEVREFLKFTHDPRQPKPKAKINKLLNDGHTKLKRNAIKINNLNFKSRNIFKTLMDKKQLEDPNFIKLLSKKKRRQVLETLDRLNHKGKWTLMLESMICSWDRYYRILQSQKQSINVRKIFERKIYQYLVKESLDELKSMCAIDWNGFNEFYEDLIVSAQPPEITTNINEEDSKMDNHELGNNDAVHNNELAQ